MPGQVSNEAGRQQGKGGAPAKPKARYPICVGTLRICSDVPRPKRGCEMKLLVKEWGVGCRIEGVGEGCFASGPPPGPIQSLIWGTANSRQDEQHY